jgi:hypothetical protein
MRRINLVGLYRHEDGGFGDCRVGRVVGVKDLWKRSGVKRSGSCTFAPAGQVLAVGGEGFPVVE